MTIYSLGLLKKQRLESPPLLPLATGEELKSYRERCNAIAALSMRYLEEWSNKEWPESSLNASLLSPKLEENSPSQETSFPDSSFALPSLFSNSSQRQELASSSSSSSSSSSLGTLPNPKKTKRKARETSKNNELSKQKKISLDALFRGVLDDGQKATLGIVSKVYGMSKESLQKYSCYIQDQVSKYAHETFRYPSPKKWKALDAYAESNRQKILDYINRNKPGRPNPAKLILSGEGEKKEVKQIEVRSGIVPLEKRIRPTRFLMAGRTHVKSKDSLENLKKALNTYMSGESSAEEAASIIGKASDEIIRITSLFKKYFKGEAHLTSRPIIDVNNFNALVSYFEGDGKGVLEKYLTGQGAKPGRKVSSFL